MRVKFQPGKQKEFFSEVSGKSSRRELSNVLSVSERCLKNWSNGKRLIPSDAYEKISVVYGLDYSKYVGFLPDNWGQTIGGNTTVSRIADIQEHMKHVYKNRKSFFGRVEHIRINDVKHPMALSAESLELDTLPLVASMLLTDGHVYRRGRMYEVGFSSKSIALSNLFLELLHLWDNKIVFSRYKDRNNVIRNYVYLPEKNDIVALTPSYKTSPFRQTKFQYLRDAQPSLKFLSKSERIYKVFCARIALSTDGCLSINFRKNGNVFGKLMLSCAHPSLCQEWKDLFLDIGLDFRVAQGKYKWCGIAGLYCYSRYSIEKFRSYGGFIEDVAISGKSRYFKGKDKNWLLNKYLDKELYQGP